MGDLAKAGKFKEVNRRRTYRWIQVALAIIIMATAVAACTSATPTPLPPTPAATLTPPTPTRGEARLLQLTFDGESCTYEGPTALTAGPVTLLFFNESVTTAYAGLLRHTGDKTIQDQIDYIGEEPSTKHAPSWVRVIPTYTYIPTGRSSTWEGSLEAGIHTIVCIRVKPHGTWFGTGLTVED